MRLNHIDSLMGRKFSLEVEKCISYIYSVAGCENCFRVMRVIIEHQGNWCSNYEWVGAIGISILCVS